MTVRCYHSWHLGFSVGLGVPLLLLVAMVVPFLPIFLLFKHRTQLAATSVKLRLGFVYHSYRCACASAYDVACMLHRLIAAKGCCCTCMAIAADIILLVLRVILLRSGSLNAGCVAVGLNTGLSSLSSLSSRFIMCSSFAALVHRPCSLWLAQYM